jgi:hypothetical protein
MLESLIHVQPLKLRLFAAGDDIHVIAAAQAMVEDAEQAVGVRWIVHADHFAPARQRIVHVPGCLVAEAIVVVAPCMTCEQNIERRERSAPGILAALLEPLGMLSGHRIDHLREGFIGGPHAMTAGEQVAFKPSLAEVLAQHFHDAAVRTEFIVDRNNLGHRAALRGLKDGVQAIGIRFIGAEHAEVCQIHSEDVAEEISSLRGASART